MKAAVMRPRSSLKPCSMIEMTVAVDQDGFNPTLGAFLDK